MKIKILGLLLTMVLLLATATQGAIYSPLPINGKVTGSNVGGLQILITNLRSDKVQSTLTTGAGEFLIDAANFDDNGGTILRYTIGDQFKIQIVACAGNPICEDTRTWMGTTDPVTGSFEIYTLLEIGDLLELEPECTVDSDCAEGYECISEECVEIEPEPECTTDSDCSANYECIDEECVYVEPEPECIEDSDCVSGYECVNEVCIEKEPEPEIEVETRVSTNSDKTMANIEAYYNQKINVCVKNNKLVKLQDKEIDFNGDDYDIHEEICFEAEVKTSLEIDGTTTEDYGLDPRIVIQAGGVKYKYAFDDKIKNLNKIDYDEELEIKFLGEDYEIIEATENRIVIEKGKLYKNKKIGDIINFNGKILKIEHIGSSEDEAYIKVSYDGESTRIVNGDIGEVGDIQVLAYDLIADIDVNNTADIKVAEEIEVTIKDGEDYSDDEMWKWDIDMPNYIAIENQEDYVYIDDDDEPMPLGLGDKIELPEGFAIIKFNDITESEVTEIEVKVKEGYLYIRGDREGEGEDAFVYNNEDYTKIYVDADGIYDKDLEPLGTKTIQIGDSEIELKVGSIIIGKLKVLLDMSDILYNSVSFAAEDENYLDYLGIIFKDPEKGVKEQAGFEIIVPDERPEVTITIGAEPKEEEDEADEEDEEEEEEEEEEVNETVTKPGCISDLDCGEGFECVNEICWQKEKEPETIPEPEPVPETIPEPETDPNTVLLRILIGLAIAVLGFFGWGAGFTGLANYWFNKGKELEAQGKKVEAKACYDRAAKMLKTALKRAKEGYYDRK